MKNKILFLAFCVVGVSVNSQTIKEREKIIKHYELTNDNSEKFDYKKYPKNEKELTILKAEKLGVPLKRVDAFGDEGYLVRFDGDLPLYYKTFNEGAAITTRANTLQPGGVLGLNLTGAGMLAGVWDENHPRVSHTDFGGRLVITDGSAISTSLHSTHVSGTIFSSGSSTTGVSGRGMAYAAQGWINDWSNDINEMNQYAGFGLLLSNHSYGLQAQNLPTWYFGAYVSDANAVDNICFNRDKYLPVYAAGNDRDSFMDYNPSKGGNDLLSGDKVSKNSLVVGAVNEVLNYLQPSNVVMSNFSSFGPTDDFRIKPDIVAKGVNVYSTTSSSNTSYGYLSGTSMSSPSVTGSLLLVQQFFGDPYLNSSTLKGLALHTADEAGTSEGPDQKFGWGLLNVGKMVEVLQDEGVNSIVEENLLNDGVNYVFDVVALGSESLKVSISWTDRPGVIAQSGVLDDVSSKLVNDIDVRVTQLANTYYPWKLNKDWSNIVALQEDNDVDPFERVDVVNPNGVYRITVSHKGALVGGSQKYSLIVTGVDVAASMSNSVFENLTEKSDIVIWQNSNDFANVNYRILDESYLLSELQIFDLNGREVSKTELLYDQGVVSLAANQKGFYLLKFISKEGKVVTKKVIR